MAAGSEANGGEVYAGVDIGSTTSKAVLIDGRSNMIAFAITDTLFDRNASGERVVGMALEKAGVGKAELARVCATGYGRKAFGMADDDVPEIMCHGNGTLAMHPGVRTIIDIGGQDSKVIRIDSSGSVSKFEMNDKCAAGTGRFFEVLSRRLLNIPMDELDELSLQSENPCAISSTCTVFAESEIVSYLSQGVPVGDISMGLLQAIARRVFSMGNQSIGFEPDIVFTGGLARSEAVRRALEERIGKEVQTVEEPQIPAALGAALYAKAAQERKKEVEGE